MLAVRVPCGHKLYKPLTLRFVIVCMQDLSKCVFTIHTCLASWVQTEREISEFYKTFQLATIISKSKLVNESINDPFVYLAFD